MVADVLTRARHALLEPITLEELDGIIATHLRELTDASHALVFRWQTPEWAEFSAGTLVPEMAEYSAEHFAADPTHSYLMRRPPELLHDPCEDQTFQGRFVQSPAYNEFYEPRDIRYIVGVWYTPHRYGQPGMTGVLLTRSRKQQRFSAASLARLQMLEPDLRAAWRRCRRTLQLQQGQYMLADVAAEVQRALVVFIGCAGAEAYMTPNAERLWYARTSRELRQRVRALCLGSAIDVPRLRLGAASVASPAARSVNGELAGIPVSAELAYRSAIKLWWIRITVDVPRRLASEYRLSPSEVRVAGKLARGDSNPQIAADLAVSFETVKTHVRHVLSKLGLHKRAEVPALFESMRLLVPPTPGSRDR